MRPSTCCLPLALILAACGSLDGVGRAPDFTPAEAGDEYFAMTSAGLPGAGVPAAPASLWSADRASLLGDRRAGTRGDILTVLIEIDDRAEFSNSSERSRAAADKFAMGSLFGIPQVFDEAMPDGAASTDAVNLKASSSYVGDGSVSRRERLTLRIAVTVIEVLPNGVLQISGSQQVRVNNEVRDLQVTGFVRPEDITRQNDIAYDKIAGARISYGGRGQISDVQQPRYGQQVVDNLLPY